MATRFEIVLHGSNPPSLRAAGEEALDEIERVEAQLSLYRASSEVARLNREAHLHPVRVTQSLLHLLERARELTAQTQGAFDITIAPLVRCWGFTDNAGAMPDAADVEAARANVGMHHVELDAEKLTVHFTRPGVMLDFGAIGKGYAIDRAVELLREAGVCSALIHGGTSTTVALGRQPDDSLWRVAVTSSGNEANAKPLAVVELEDESLSVSAAWGRSFRVGEKVYGHIIDPRTGAPSEKSFLSAVLLPSATESDALSTALMTAPELMDTWIRARPDMRCLVVNGTSAVPAVAAHRIEISR